MTVTKKTKKGEINYTSVTYKNPDGQITKQIIKDGDSFTARIPKNDPKTGKLVGVHEYNTNPEAGKIVPHNDLQRLILSEAIGRIF